MRTIHGLALTLIALIAGCATATPYQPVDGGFGYAEQKIESNRYRVTFAGNSRTELQTVENYVLHRAAEVTLAQAYDYFIVSDRTTKGEAEDRQPTVTFGFGSFGFGHHHHGGVGIGTSAGREGTEYQGAIEILLMRGKKPADNANAFDARQILENLGPAIQRPERKEPEAGADAVPGAA
ncbi:MAG TPA: hypothetical protein VM240_10840 [Verrucomicrobiae bacterium]|nr:hypothetical protein [Verrucomicrobiae bacterium]